MGRFCWQNPAFCQLICPNLRATQGIKYSCFDYIDGAKKIKGLVTQTPYSAGPNADPWDQYPLKLSLQEISAMVNLYWFFHTESYKVILQTQVIGTGRDYFWQVWDKLGKYLPVDTTYYILRVAKSSSTNTNPINDKLIKVSSIVL